MTNFWFWLRYDSDETQFTYDSSRINLQKLSYKPTQCFSDTSTSKVFSDCEFYVDVGGSHLNQDAKTSCTLYLTDDFKIRISIYLNYVDYLKFSHNLRNGIGDCMRFCISDFINLEKHSNNLLNGSNPQNTFVKDIDDFQLGTT